MDLATATVPQNLTVVDALHGQVLTDVRVSFDEASRYLQVAPARSWPLGSLIWIGVRGYQGGLRAAGQPVVASVAYDLLKRDESLTCGATTAALVPDTCPFLLLLAQQMPPAAARRRCSSSSSCGRR